MKIFASYEFTKISILIGKEEIEVKPTDVVSLTMNKLYYTKYLPDTILTLNLDKQIILKCTKSNELKIALTIVEIKMDKDDKSVSKKTILNLALDADCLASDVLFDKDYSFVKDKKEKENYTPDNFMPVDFQIYNYDHLNMFKIKHGAVLKKCNPVTALIYCFNARKNSKYTISKPEVGKEYPSIVLPFGDLFYNVLYLNENYGLYRSAPALFYDYEDMEGLILIDKNQLPMTTLKDKRTTMFIHPNEDGESLKVPFEDNHSPNSTMVTVSDRFIMFENVDPSMISMVEGARVVEVKDTSVKMNTVVPKSADNASMKVVSSKHPLSIAQNISAKEEYDKLKFEFENVPLSHFKMVNVYMVKHENTYRKYHLIDLSFSLIPSEQRFKSKLAITLGGIK